MKLMWVSWKAIMGFKWCFAFFFLGREGRRAIEANGEF